MTSANRKPGARIRVVTTTTVIILALAAAILSYYSLSQLAQRSGIAEQLTWLFPIIIDGLILSGSMLVLYSAIYNTRPWFGWLLTLLGVGASTTGNIVVAPENLTAQIVHAAPPLILALSLEGLMMLLRHGSKLRTDEMNRDVEDSNHDEPESNVKNPVVVSPQVYMPAITREKLHSFTQTTPITAKSPKTQQEGSTIRDQVITMIKSGNSSVDVIADSIEGDRKYIRKITRDELRKYDVKG